MDWRVDYAWRRVLRVVQAKASGDRCSSTEWKQRSIGSPTRIIVPSGDSPRDSFDCSTDAVYVLKAAMESQGYIFRDCGDHLSYTRPGKTDFSHTISGTLGRKNTNGKPYLHNFSTSDPNFDPESYGLSEAYKVLLNLDNAALMTRTGGTLGSAGLVRKVSQRWSEISSEEWGKSILSRVQGSLVRRSRSSTQLSHLANSGTRQAEGSVESTLSRACFVEVRS